MKITSDEALLRDLIKYDFDDKELKHILSLYQEPDFCVHCNGIMCNPCESGIRAEAIRALKKQKERM